MSNNQGIDLSGMPDQAIGVITAPRAFFRAMPRTGGYLDPIIFLLAMGLIAALLQLVLGFIGLGAGGVGGVAAAGFFVLIMLPVFLLVFGFVGAAIAFVIWRFLGSRESFETAFRCVAYMWAIAPITVLLSAIPYLGSLVHVAWAFYLLIIASVEVHGIAEKTATIVFAVVGVIVAFLGLSNEYATRNFQQRMEQMSSQLGQNMENKTPEELGQAVGEFIKGLENATLQSGQQAQ